MTNLVNKTTLEKLVEDYVNSYKTVVGETGEQCEKRYKKGAYLFDFAVQEFGKEAFVAAVADYIN